MPKSKKQKRGDDLMNCAVCGEANRQGAKFCAECGTPFAKVCSSCNSELRPAAKFCDECGTSTVAQAPPLAPAPGDAVRKTVTVFFADLVGSTSFAEQVDAESARSAMGRYHETAQRVIDRHAGSLVKFIGDGVMAVFGIPDVTEDDALRAVRAGLDLQSEFTAVQAAISDRFNVELGLRVGINTGEIVIADDDADLVGDALNTAARLEAVCEPGSVLVGEDTWRLTRSSVQYEVLDEVSVKGKAAPIASFRALTAGGDDDFQTPFVGREHELDQLTVGFDAANAAGHAAMITVIGSPGVGKTRLAAELRERTSDYSHAYDLRVDPAGTSTFAPVAELLRSAVGLDADTDEAITVALLEEFTAGEVGASDGLVSVLASFVGAAPAKSTEESFWATRRLLEILGRIDAMVLVIDDIQWAEPLFLDLLEHLVEWVEAPVLIVGLARPEIREIRPSLSEAGGRVNDVISIDGLDASSTERLAAEILGTSTLPAELVEMLPDSTQGNPLFVRELVRMLVDDDVITQVGDTWYMAVDRDAVVVPPTVQSLLAARVERMPDDERHLLEMASVVGSEFARGAVEALMPNTSPGELDRLFESLRRKESVDPTGTYWGNEAVLRFHHVLIRDAAYRRILKGRRAELHLLVAEWTELASSHFAGGHEIAVAHHLEQAYRYRQELNQVDQETLEIGERAAALLSTAADRALDQDDLAAAGALALRALECVGSSATAHPELLLTGCEALISAGDANNVAPLIGTLREAAAVGDERLGAWCDAFEGQLAVLTSPDELESSEAQVSGAAERLDALGDQSGVAKARLVRALILFNLGRIGDCEAELDRALTAARAADDRRRITSVLGAAPVAALWGPSPVARAGGRCLDIIRLLRITSASPMVEATSIRCQGVLEAMRGRYDQARELLGRSRDVVEDLGLRQGALETEMFAGIVELFAGDPEAAEVFLRRAYGGFDDMGARSSAGTAASYLAKSLLVQGRIDEAEAAAVEADSLAGQTLRTAIMSRAVLGEIAASHGRHDDALTLAGEAMAIAAGTDLTIDHAVAADSLATIHRHAGNMASAQAARAVAGQLFDSKGAVLVRTSPDQSVDVTGTDESAIEVHPPENDATRWMVTYFSEMGINQRNVDGYIDALHPEAKWTVPGPGQTIELDRDGIRSWIEATLGPDDDLTSVIESVATRGQNLAVLWGQMTRSSTFTTGGHMLVELGDDGRLISGRQYGADELDMAMGALRELEFARLGDEYNSIQRAMDKHARGGHSGHAGVALLHPRYAFIDHRFIGLEPVTRDSLLEDGSDDDNSFIAIERLRLTPKAALTSFSSQRTGSDFRSYGYHLVVMAGDHIINVELFGPDSLEHALARMDELVAAETSVLVVADPDEETLPRGGREFPEVRDIIDGLIAARVAGDAHRQAAFMSPHVDYVDHRSFSIPDTVDGRVHQMTPQLMGETELRTEISQFLALNEVGAVFHVDESSVGPDGGVLERETVFLLTLTDGLVEHLHTFEASDQATALETFAEFTADASTLRPTNVVSQIMEGAWAQVRAGDLAEMKLVVPPSCVIVDNRHVSALPDGSPQTLFDAIRAYVDMGAIFDDETLTVRGEFAAMQRVHIRTNEFTSTMLTIAVRDSDGLTQNITLYDDEDIEPARAELDRLYDEVRSDVSAQHPTGVDLTKGITLFHVEGPIARWVSEHDELVATDQYAGLEALYHPDMQMVSQRTGNPGMSTSTASIIESIQQATEIFGVHMELPLVATRGDRIALLKASWSGTDTFDQAFLVAMGYGDDGLAIRSVTFDVDQIDEAHELLDQWFVESLDDDCATSVALAHAFSAADVAGDLDALSSLMSVDCLITDKRPGSFGNLDRDGYLERVRTMHEVVPGFAATVLAIHRVVAEGLVVEVHIGEPQMANEWHFAVTMLHDEAQVGRVEFRDVEELDAAIAEFEVLPPADSSEPPLSNLASETMMRAWSALLDDHDVDTWIGFHSPDVVWADRRALVGGLGDLDLEDLRSFGDAALEGGDPVWRQTAIDSAGDEIALVRISGSRHESEFQTRVLAVVLVEDSLITRLVSFDDDAEVEARAEFERLATTFGKLESAGSDHPLVVRVPRAMITATSAARLADQAVRAAIDNDHEAWNDILTSDYVFENRSAGNPDLTIGGAESWTLFSTGVEQHGGQLTSERIATRGELLVLQRMLLGQQEDFEEEMYFVLAADEEGKLRRTISFGEADLDLAYEHLDELFKQSLPEGLGVAVDSMRLATAVTRGEDLVEEFAATFSEDLMVVDNRGLSFPTLDKAGQIERMRSGSGIYPKDVRVLSCTVHRATSLGGVVSLEAGSTSADAVDLPKVNLFLVADGLVTRLEYFEPEGLAAAIERFEAFEAEAGSPEAQVSAVKLPETTATLIAESAVRAISDEDRSAWTELLADEYLYESRRAGNPGLNADGAETWTLFSTGLGLHRGRVNSEAIAARGDHLAMYRTVLGHSDEFEERMFFIQVVDENGKLSRTISFDDDSLDRAYDHLDELFQESLPEGLRVMVRSMRLATAVTRGEDVVEDFAATLSEGLMVLDNRGLSYPTLDKAGQIERTVGGVDLYPSDLRATSCGVLRATNEGGVFVIETGSGSADAVDLARVNLVLVADGLVTRLEYFEPDAAIDAIERFDHLRNQAMVNDQHDEADLKDHEEPNSVDEPADAVFEETDKLPGPDDVAALDLESLCGDIDTALGTRNWAVYEELLTEGFTHVDHRVSAAAIQSREDAIEAERTAASLFGHCNACEVVSSMDGRLVVRQGDYGPPGARVMAFVCVTEFNEFGLALRTETFDARNRDDAEQLLQEWYEEGATQR